MIDMDPFSMAHSVSPVYSTGYWVSTKMPYLHPPAGETNLTTPVPAKVASNSTLQLTSLRPWCRLGSAVRQNINDTERFELGNRWENISCNAARRCIRALAVRRNTPPGTHARFSRSSHLKCNKVPLSSSSPTPIWYHRPW